MLPAKNTLLTIILHTLISSCHSANVPQEESFKGIPPGLSIESLKLDESRTRGRSTTTTSRPIIPAPKSTTSNVDTTGDVLYRLDNNDGRACVLMLTDALIEIDYVTNLKEKKKSNVYVPDKYDRDGKCEEDFSQFAIIWPSYKLTIDFAKNPGRDHWYVKKIELIAKLSDKHLAHVNRPPGSELHFKSPEGKTYFPTPVGNAFTCKGDNLVELYDKDITAYLYLRELKLQPFIFKKDDFGPEHICTAGASSYRDETAPIAVGSTFAIITILTVAGYGVYRYMKVKKVQYDTME